ncbi:hypothetical protein IA57_08495 [Mangrovimonas yunxiaonensis]|uniref:Uncharacterized protein n=1 Tax=Mangrovimonas yunxiaonensis TaxID=1197477 RepID=A0A084TIH4_9FLAO|nr:hypothetical protein [Mangrovimonas yunxiaonensis]KFB00510.1 hypothetical protein IA57_08495 [Mangrovimonas yunxiaonensis]
MMKSTKSFYLTILVSCFIMLSCDDNVNEVPNTENILTEENYIYESSMYKQYLNTEISYIEEEIATLQAIIDNNEGNEETQANLEAAQEELIVLNSIIATLKPMPIGGVPIPPPPPPCPTIMSTCIPIDVNYIVCDSNYTSLTVNVFSNAEVLLGSTTNSALAPLPNFGAETSYQPLTLEQGYVGDAFIEIIKVNTEGVTTAYQVQAYIRE